MANPSFEEHGRGLRGNFARRGVGNLRGMAGFGLTAVFLVAVAVAGLIAMKDRGFEPALIMAPNPPARVRPEEPGGRVTEYHDFTLNEIIAGNDAPVDVEHTEFAPPNTGLADDDLSPRTRRNLARRLSGLNSSTTAGSPGGSGVRAGEAELIWSAHVASRDWQAREISTTDVAPGTHIAQLDDVANEAEAMIELLRLQENYPKLLAGVDWYLEGARSGGAAIVRLRVTGFGSRKLQEFFCYELESRIETCIPTVSR